MWIKIITVVTNWWYSSRSWLLTYG